MEREPDQSKTLVFSGPELRWVAAAVRAVLPGGAHAFWPGDCHPLTGATDEEMAALSARLDGLVARL